MPIQSKLKKQKQKKKLIKIIVFGVISTLLFALFPIIPQAEAGYAHHIIVNTDFNGADSVYTEDIDGDQDMDVIGAAMNKGVAWWANDDGFGGSWTKTVLDDTFCGGVGPCTVYSADINGDGAKDILGISNDEIAWWENSSWTKHQIDTDALVGWVKAGDIDGDGDMDVIGTAGSASYKKINLWKNDGSGTFTNMGMIVHPGDNRPFDVADIDNNGNLDIAVADTTSVGTVWFKNDGSGNFSQQDIDPSFDSYAVYCEDIDNDGDMDVVAGGATETVWFKNLGGGTTWSTPNTIDASSSYRLQVEDMDGDGDMDVARIETASTYRDIGWFENAFQGTSWTYRPVVENWDYPYSIYTTDIDGDEYTDILGASGSAGFGRIDWWEPEKRDLGAGDDIMKGVAVGDGDNDLDKEVYGANWDGHIYQFTWDGAGWDKVDVGSVLGPPVGKMDSLAVGDGDNNGNNEVYSACVDNNIYRFKYTAGAWNSIAIGSGGGNMLDVAVGDGDGDGTEEVYGACAGDGHVYRFVCTGNCDDPGGWTTIDLGTPVAGAMQGIAIGDGDNDGKNEVYGSAYDGGIYRFKCAADCNNPANWNILAIGFGGVGMWDVAVGDGDNDTKYEVYGANADKNIYQLKCITGCDDQNNWEKIVIGSGTDEMTRVTVGDGDNDNQNEVYGANEDIYVYQFKWNGTSWDKHDLFSGGSRMFGVTVGDGDNDTENEIYGANEDHHAYEFESPSKHKVGGLVAGLGLDVVSENRPWVNAEDTELAGLNDVSINKAGYKIAGLRVDFSQILDWSDITAGKSGNKTYIDISFPSHPEIIGSVATLYAPSGGADTAIVCQGATSTDMAGVNCYDNYGPGTGGPVTAEYTIQVGGTPTDVKGTIVGDPHLARDGDYLELVGVAGTSMEPLGAEEAVPEFTAITIVIAAVVGFGIYLLIRRRNQKRLSKEA